MADEGKFVMPEELKKPKAFVMPEELKKPKAEFKMPEELKKPKSALSIAKDIFLPEVGPDPAAAPNPTTFSDAVTRPFTDLPKELARQRALATEEMEGGIKRAYKNPTLANIGLGGLQTIGGGLNYLTSPISGAARAFVFNPASRIAGQPKISEIGALNTDIAAQFPEAVGKLLMKLGVKGADLLAKAPGPGQALTAKVGEKAKASSEGGVAGSVENVLSPTTRSAEAGKTGEILTETFAKAAKESSRAREIMEESMATVLRMPETERFAFMDTFERGQRFADPALNDTANGLRAILKQREAWLSSRGLLDHAIANYFPHIWKNPRAAQNVLEQFNALSKGGSGLQGSKNFLKQRTVDTIAQGRALGLELVSTNPLELVAIKIQEIDRFIAGQAAKEEMIASGLARPIKLGDRIPPGWTMLNDPAFRAGSKAYIAPNSAARVFNNALSVGLKGGKLFDTVRYSANMMNRLQLAIPGYHAIFVMRDVMTSELARAAMRLSKGDVLGAGKSAIMSMDPTRIARQVIKGKKIQQAMLRGTNDPALTQMVNAWVMGGGRSGMDAFYRGTGSGGFLKAIKGGYFTAAVKDIVQQHGLAAMYKVPLKMLETISEPLMEDMVPRAKMGVFADMAQDWLKTNPTASQVEVRTAMQKIMDSVDNRMGEMVYDNLFWNKTLKDLAMVTTRSVGWNLGTVRELGGAAVDTGRFAKGGDFTDRMAYAIAMPIMTATQGAILTYMMTGKGPQEAMDYFFPPTGRTLATGSKERIALPGYDKDVMEYNEHPVGTVIGKINPLMSTIRDVYNNRDYGGGMIYTTPGVNKALGMSDADALAATAKDIAKYAFMQYLPFGSVGELLKKGAAQVTGEKFPIKQQKVAGETPLWLQMMYALGINPAPVAIGDPENADRQRLKYEDIPAWRKTQRRNAQSGL